MKDNQYIVWSWEQNILGCQKVNYLTGRPKLFTFPSFLMICITYIYIFIYWLYIKDEIRAEPFKRITKFACTLLFYLCHFDSNLKKKRRMEKLMQNKSTVAWFPFLYGGGLLYPLVEQFRSLYCTKLLSSFCIYMSSCVLYKTIVKINRIQRLEQRTKWTCEKNWDFNNQIKTQSCINMSQWIWFGRHFDIFLLISITHL